MITQRGSWLIPRVLLLATWLMATGALAADAAETEPYENYRVLDWQDLVPEGWEPPLVARAFDEVSAATVDAGSVVSELDGQLAAVPGYMKPTVFEEDRVLEFVLVPYLPHQTQAHSHLEPNQMVYVYPLEPLRVEEPFEPIWIVGTLALDPVMTDEGPAAYRMVDAVTTAYEY